MALLCTHEYLTHENKLDEKPQVKNAYIHTLMLSIHTKLTDEVLHRSVALFLTSYIHTLTSIIASLHNY